ncbi:MAG: HD domain-containing protein [Candidatus Hodarchaeota archaeon]
MKRKPRNKRYIYDPIYGVIYLEDFIWDIISCTELQRLREVRLCNINSLCLTGGANINRFEHAIGTYHIAEECLNSWPLLNPVSVEEEKRFLLAALLHDVVSAAFGHSLEYIESREGFEHEKAFDYVIIGEKTRSYRYKLATLEPIFFGRHRELISKLSEEDLKAIGAIIAGRGKFGQLINSTMDLDNIDNVFRLGYHIGLVKSGDVPLKLARSLYTQNGRLVVRKEALPLIEEWHKIRKKLYLLLLLNPEEFSGKCMLTEAIELSKIKQAHPFNWYDVDHELLEKLANISSESSMIISRLMRGDLYGCIAIFSTANTDKYRIFNDTDKRRELEGNLSKLIRSTKFSSRFKSALIALHPIVDENKIERQVRIRTNDGRFVQVGKSSKQILIGIFFKNTDLNMYKISNIHDDTMRKIREEISKHLSEVLEDENLREVDLYEEAKKCE